MTDGMGINFSVNGDSVKKAVASLRNTLLSESRKLEQEFQLRAGVRLDQLKAELQALKELLAEYKANGEKQLAMEATLEIKNVSGKIKALEGDIEKSKQAMERPITPELALSRLQTQLREEKEMLREAIKLGNTEMELKARMDIRETEGKIQQLKSDMKELESETGNSTGKMEGFFMKLAKSAAFIWIANQIKNLISSAVNLADQYERNRIAFTTMLGSSDAASKMLNDLDAFSNKYAQNRKEVIENSKQLLAMNVAQSKIIPTMKALGDVSSGLNADLSRLAYNYGQISSQGVLTSRDMKDFAMMGVPLIDELAKNLGKTNGEIKQMMTDGNITFSMVEQAFQTMSDEGGKFADMMEKNKNTWSGLWTQALNTIQIISVKVGDFMIPGLKEALYLVERLFEGKPSTSLEGNIRKLSDELRDLDKVAEIFRKEQEELDKQLQANKINPVEYANKINELRMNIEKLAKDYDKANKKMEVQNFLHDTGIKYAEVFKNKLTDLQKEEESLRNEMINLNKEDKNYQKNLDEIKKKSEENKVAQEQLKSAYAILTTYIYNAADAGKTLEEIQNDLNAMRSDPSQIIDSMKREAEQALATAMAMTSLAQAKLMALQIEKSNLSSGNRLQKGWSSIKDFMNVNDPVNKRMKEAQEMLDLRNGKLETAKLGLANVSAGTAALGEIASDTSKDLDNITGEDGKKDKSREKAIKELEKSIDGLEKKYNDVIKDQKNFKEKTEEYARAQKELYREVEKAIKKVNEEQHKLGEEYEKTIDKIYEDRDKAKNSSIEDSLRDYQKAIIDAEKEQRDMTRGYDEHGKEVKYDWSEYNKLTEEIKAYKENIQEIRNMLSQGGGEGGEGGINIDAILKEVSDYEDLKTDAERELYDLKKQLAEEDEEARKKAEEETQEYNKQVEALEKKRKIIETINMMENLTQEDVDRIRDSEMFKDLDTETQDEILNRADKKVQLEQQNQELIEMKKDLYRAEQAMIGETTSIAVKNLDILDGKYQKIISDIQGAISLQRELNILQANSGGGYSLGGYTGAGGKYEVAGVVHKGEYVIPQRMVQKMDAVVAQLEDVRQHGFAEGGMVGQTNNYNTTKNQQNHITVNNSIDLRAFLDYAKRKM